MRGQHHAPAALYSGKDLVPVVQEAGWAPGPVWTGEENLAPTGIRTTDRPTRSQSLYHLRYPAYLIMCTLHEILRTGKIKAESNGWSTKNTRDGYMLVGKHEQEMHVGKSRKRYQDTIRNWFSKKTLCKDAERIRVRKEPMVDFAKYDNEGNSSLPTHIFHNIPTKLYSSVNYAFSENSRSRTANT